MSTLETATFDVFNALDKLRSAQRQNNTETLRKAQEKLSRKVHSWYSQQRRVMGPKLQKFQSWVKDDPEDVEKCEEVFRALGRSGVRDENTRGSLQDFFKYLAALLEAEAGDLDDLANELLDGYSAKYQ